MRSSTQTLDREIYASAKGIGLRQSPKVLQNSGRAMISYADSIQDAVASVGAEGYVAVNDIQVIFIKSAFQDEIHFIKVNSMVGNFWSSIRERIRIKEICGWPSFVDDALTLSEAGRIDSAMDAVYDGVDDLMIKGEWAALDFLFEKMSPRSHGVAVCVALLSASLPGKQQLKKRRSLYNRVHLLLSFRGLDCQHELAGLD